MENDFVLLVVSKSTGYKALKSFLCQNKKKAKVLTLNDSLDPRSHLEKIKKLCLINEIECSEAKGPACLSAFITKHQPDYVFVCGWYWIITDEILSKVAKGVYGIHNSLLPKYRGHAPLVWSLLNGDEVVGASLFEITTGLDTGLIYHQWCVSGKERYIYEVMEELEFCIENEFANLFFELMSGTLQGKDQDNSQASYGAKRTVEDGLINWTLPASYIERQVRTLNDPYPLSYGYFNEKKIHIKNAKIFNFKTFSAPGQVVFKEKDSVVIGCGDNTALIVYEAFDENHNSELASLFTKITAPSRVRYSGP